MLPLQLLAAGEIQPGISKEEFARRRHKLAQLLPSGGLAVLSAARQVFMTGIIPYPYRQNADFQYLTGVIQPGPLATVNSDGRFTLFVPEENHTLEVWNGARLCVDAAADFFGADAAYPINEMPQRLSAMVSKAPAVALDAKNADLEPLASALEQLPALQEAERQGRVQPLQPLVHSLRWVKSQAELRMMGKSASVAAHAMVKCMEATRPSGSEHGIAALFEYECRRAGAQRMAYPPVVGSGADGCTIHYSRNDKLLKAKELLLLDGGCELWGYCSDVTRTWPVGGKFVGAQRALYDAVHAVHTAVLAEVRPGATVRALHQLSVRLLTEALMDLGIVRRPAMQSILPKHVLSMGGVRGAAAAVLPSITEFYPHSVGHYLGMDTHDTAKMATFQPLQPGCVITIEPGLYIPDDEEAFGMFAGVGIRLEDDIEVTSRGANVLSCAAPIEPDEIEQCVGSSVLRRPHSTEGAVKT